MPSGKNKDCASDYIQKNIDALVKMAKKDRYESYRDIIYYTAAQMELERNNKPGAEAFLLKCVRSSVGGQSTQRTKAFLQLAGLTFEDKKYKAAKSYYDSLNQNLLSPEELRLNGLPDRKTALDGIVRQQEILDRQDSLQRIARFPRPKGTPISKSWSVICVVSRACGMRPIVPSRLPILTITTRPPLPIFSATVPGTADWYFYNPSLKAKGFSDFKTKMGQPAQYRQLADLIARPTARAGQGGRTPGLHDPRCGRRQSRRSYDNRVSGPARRPAP